MKTSWQLLLIALPIIVLLPAENYANDFATPLLTIGCALSDISNTDDAGWGYFGSLGVFREKQYYGIKYSQHLNYDFYNGIDHDNTIQIFDLIYGYGQIDKIGFGAICSGISILKFNTDTSNKTIVGIPIELTAGAKAGNAGIALKLFCHLTTKAIYNGIAVSFVLDPTLY